MKDKLLKIILLRILSSFAILFFVVSLVFVIIHLSPGNPAQKFISPNLNQKLFEEISKSYHLNDSLIKQYTAFIKNSFTGKFGISYNYREPVVSVINYYLSFTILFGLLSFLSQILITFLLTYFTFQFNSYKVEKTLSNITLTLYSVPIFISSVFLVYIFSFKMNLLPASGLRSFDFDELNLFQQFLDYSKHLILPLIASSFAAIPIYYKYLYGSIKSISNMNFVKNLKVIGLSENKILFQSIIPNSLNSLIAVAGVELGVLLSGSVLIETIFGLPGLGRLTVTAVITRDYPLIIAVVLLSSVIVLVVNLISDVLRVLIDKRLSKKLLS